MEPVTVRIHPTALVSPEAELAGDVTVGAFAVLEGKVRLGPGCVVHPRAQLIGPLTMGRDNHVRGNAVLGERPQHVGYRDEPTGVEVGDGNHFGERVTVHRGTGAGGLTRIGDGNHFLAGAHVAHDCRVGSRCTLGGNALLAGHCEVGDAVQVGGNAGVHQFCRLGRLAALGVASATTKDVPPFVRQEDRNTVVGVNEEGMRREGLREEQIDAMRRVYAIVFVGGLSLPDALARAEGELGAVDVVREFVDFVRRSRRGGINRTRAEGPNRTS